MMAQAMFIYYGMLPLLGLNLSMWQAAYFIVSINTGAYMAETVRGGILSIDPGQTEGAKAIGMTTCTDHDQCHSAPGTAKHHAADRQQPDHQHQGYMRTFRDRYCRAASIRTKSVAGALYTYFEPPQ